MGYLLLVLAIIALLVYGLIRAVSRSQHAARAGCNPDRDAPHDPVPLDPGDDGN